MSEDKWRTKDSCWSVGTIYDSRELLGLDRYTLFLSILWSSPPPGLKVSHGNRIILKGNRLNNIYYLQFLTLDAEDVSITFQKRCYFDDTKSCSSSKPNDFLDLVDIQI
jgi:hypothetical protein